jgi:outer membrane protein insertion porin family
VFVLCLARIARAQDDPQPTPSTLTGTAELEDRLVRRVTLRAIDKDGRPIDLDLQTEQLVRNQLRTQAGLPLRTEATEGDVTRLDRLGRFKTVSVRAEMLEDASVEVVFELRLQPIILDIQTVGNSAIPDNDLLATADLLVGTPVDRYKLDRAARQMESLYRQKGFANVRVTIDDEELEKAGIVLFRVAERQRLKVTDIRFEGNHSFSASQLRSQVSTKTAWLLDKGRLDEDVLTSDVGAIIAFYRDRGYIDVRADRSVRESPNGREAIVTFVIDEGPVYTLGDVEVYYADQELMREFPSEEDARAARKEGEHLTVLGRNRVLLFRDGALSVEQVAGYMRLKSGDVYSMKRADEALEDVRFAFDKMGYAYARVERFEKRDPRLPRVDILLEITQRERLTVGEVVITGNEITRQEVIRRKIEAKPGRPLSREDLRKTERDLERLQFFERGSVRTAVQPEDPRFPGQRDVVVDVREANTGEFNFGAAVSSDSGVIGRIALVQRNFDLFDPPDSADDLLSGRSFRGGGQRFSVELQPGNEVQTYSISLADPALNDSEYAGNASVFYQQREYRNYDEGRYGTRFGVGRRFGERWNVTLASRIENVELTDIEPGQPTDIFDFAGPSWLTSVGLNISRSTLDDPIRPSRGTVIEFGAEQVGALGGDFNFSKLSASHEVYFTLNRSFLGYKTVLSVKTELGYIPQDPEEVPPYERFYLGGRSFRGFDYRAISPVGIRNDTGEQGDDPVGGTWSFFWGTEVVQPVWDDTISLAFFLDTGTVTDDPGFDDYRVSIGSGLRFYIPQLSPAPLAFDFGFPLVSQETDRERVFTFSLDIPF